MNETERVKDWANFYRASAQKSSLNALLACLETDGERVLGKVLLELGLASALDLIKDARKK
jgi:hypothetical protein